MAGKTYNDLKLAGEVRTLTLKEIERVLKGTDEVYKKELVLKLAANCLPRLNEHSGPDGGDIPIPLLHVLNNNSNKKDSEPQQTN